MYGINIYKWIKFIGNEKDHEKETLIALFSIWLQIIDGLNIHK